MRKIVLLLLIFCSYKAQAQYKYSIDLNSVVNDRVAVQLSTPAITTNEVLFKFPKIIPGTYMISDFGRFIHNVKAFDRKGKSLTVKKQDNNSWKISNAKELSRLTYEVEDSWDSENNDIYSMAGTNIEEKKNFVLNTPGFFGYFEGHRNTPFVLQISKPADFYGSTPLIPTRASNDKDEFLIKNVDELYDSPIMYNRPDTTSIFINGSQILVSVYSPTKKLTSAFIAQNLTQLLWATAKYLGGRIPVKKYAFLFYFNGEQQPFKMPGALEHNYSSFYSLPEIPQQQFIKQIMDIAGHEFFHVITPLNVSSKEVKVFNFDEPVLSQHLWLYEGTTEYVSDHVQVKYGLSTIPEYFNKLSEKIQNSSKYFNDTLSFTELSKFSATKHKAQFGNVYEKGALIAACLDLYLLHLSDGAYDLNKLKTELATLYGKEKYFEDKELFDIITKLTFPEIRTFFKDFVEGNKPLPLARFLGYAGFNYSPSKTTSLLTFGEIVPSVDQQGKVFIADVSKMNDFGKKMGYKANDELVTINKVPVNGANMVEVFSRIKGSLKEGENLTMEILRKNENGEKVPVTLSAPAAKISTTKNHVIDFMPSVTPTQAKIRSAWLTYGERMVSPPDHLNDAKSIPSIILAMYNTISGPAGPRNWERFRSLFNPQAKMSALVALPNGSDFYATMTPEEYIINNTPFFESKGFFEEEIGRRVHEFGNLATVQSAYQYSLTKDGPAEKRGVNYISLVKTQGRWWITNVVWQEESANNPIPSNLLNRKE